MNHSSIAAIFPAPKHVDMLAHVSVATPVDLKLMNHADANDGECFCRGFSLASQKPVTLPIIGTDGTPILLLSSSTIPADGYRLSILNDSIRIESSSAGGFQYAGTTFGQLIELYPITLPGMIVFDVPAFPRRGVMLDISRNKVPTMATLYELVDRLARWKINHLQLYTEHTFAYASHPEIWKGASPMTGEEIRKLDDYCRMLNIDLAANQNSFGHLHRWLNHPDYRHLAECPNGYMTPWGEQRKGPFSLNPLHPGSIELLAGLYDELLPNFSSTLFNVGCDETFDLGQGASRSECETLGKGRVYFTFLRKINDLVKARGMTTMFWGDIVLNHPELIPELDKESIALVWGYEAGHPFQDQCRAFADAGIPYWVCPGTSNWNSITGRFDNAIANLDSAAKAGTAHGASGFLITEWGDNGHWQTMPTTCVALAVGASTAWCGKAPDATDLKSQIDHADVVIDLGRIYLDAGFPLDNTSPLFPLIRFSEPANVIDRWSVEALAQAGLHVEKALAGIPHAVGAESARKLWRDEIQLGGEMLRHAIHRGLWLKAGKPPDEAPNLSGQMRHIRDELQRLWLLRNREGGLSESLEPLAMRQREYEH